MDSLFLRFNELDGPASRCVHSAQCLCSTQCTSHSIVWMKINEAKRISVLWCDWTQPDIFFFAGKCKSDLMYIIWVKWGVKAYIHNKIYDSCTIYDTAIIINSVIASPYSNDLCPRNGFFLHVALSYKIIVFSKSIPHTPRLLQRICIVGERAVFHRCGTIPLHCILCRFLCYTYSCPFQWL